MKVLLVNPSDVSFGTDVITPRWLYVIAAAFPKCYGDPAILEEPLAQVDPAGIRDEQEEDEEEEEGYPE